MFQLLSRHSKTGKQSPDQMAKRALVLGRIQGLQQAISAMKELPGSAALDQHILDLQMGFRIDPV